MPYTLRSNHNISGFISQAESLINSFDLDTNSKYLFLSLFGAIDQYIPCVIENYQPGYDFVVVLFPFESPDYYKCIKPCKEIVESLYKAKFAVIDCGSNINLCKHFCYNTFINENHDSWIPCDWDQRIYYYVCANRVLKTHRIKLLNNLYSFPIKERILTAGNYNLRQKIRTEINFPVPLAAPDECQVLNPDFESQRYMPNSFKQCIFNLVTESSYENTGDTFETWSRIMVTEKSIRPFRLHQLPIFLAPAGHVEYLRNLKFDVFDDIIDHSYDLCHDSNKRIELVTGLIQNLFSKSLSEWQTICSTNQKRFEYNRKHCDSVKHQLDFDLVNSFNAWASAKII